jgi:hypothetical protein
MSVYERLKARNIVLPQVDPPVAAFAPFVRTGNLLFISGHSHGPANSAQT